MMVDKKNGNKAWQLLEQGQSIWLDSIQRGQIKSGELKKLMDEVALRGETANPSIFEKAVAGSADYDDQIRALSIKGLDANGIYEAIATDDVRAACDVFRPLYDEVDGADGFVSLEVSPKLAYDTEGTLAEVRRFWKIVDRPNLMIKIPGTPQGVPAIEEALYEGININITLLFAVEAYEKVAWAYISALQRRVLEGKPIDHLASVASFFVSRIDILADKLVEERIKQEQDPQKYEELNDLKGKIAIANAKIAYEKFKKIFADDRFQALRGKGARVQRPLWASTSTKNPAYPDTLYVDNLIGPDTVNTLPLETIRAFIHHGQVERTVDKDVDKAHQVIQQFEAFGFSLDAVTSQVLKEGVEKFDEAFDKLLEVIEQKKGAIKQQAASTLASRPGVQISQGNVDWSKLVERLWQRDASLWTDNSKHQELVRNRLGWLDVAHRMRAELDDLKGFATEAIGDGIKHVLLLGMGGSSLAPEVMEYTFGIDAGFPNFAVLDTTDPKTVREYLRVMNPADTLYLVSSKSGTTLETLCFFKFYYGHVLDQRGDRAGASFAAITDPGTPLEKLAKERHFRRVFSNPADIGGRYSALSFFGLVPGALIGLDLSKLLDRAEEMMGACQANVPADQNPGLQLGRRLGELYERGRDKVTFILSPEIDKFGNWLEQLLAESTGKSSERTGQPTGLVPIAGEPLGAAEVYGDDRIFVYLRLDDTDHFDLDDGVAELEKAGQPVIRIGLKDKYDLGGEFFRWEFATAVAGALIGINPFDEPNVAESKANTERVLEEYEQGCKLPEFPPTISENGISLFWNHASTKHDSLLDYLREFLDGIRRHDYIALMAYLTHSPASDHALTASRVDLRAKYKAATTMGYGPRFLHSTGQLHKGGPNEAVFIQITQAVTKDLNIAGEEFTFGVLRDAQAIGDLQALQNHHHRVIRLHLSEGTDISALQDVFKAAVTTKEIAPREPAAIVSAGPTARTVEAPAEMKGRPSNATDGSLKKRSTQPKTRSAGKGKSR